MSFDRDLKEFPACDTCREVPCVGLLHQIRDDEGRVIENICHDCLAKRNEEEKQQ